MWVWSWFINDSCRYGCECGHGLSMILVGMGVSVVMVYQ